ncbi:STAS/SEC14 domain-containing protein [Mobilicoccus pelagius]|uniref:STAS/SEC14 domain-containing protein n=1 Tax=Mobilicoccus pelagius TaxID=746032 RepID=UPI00145F0152|nr:STAS/SEC14 domain-containing protein [Mobilicoccus pelagius]
MTTQIEPGTNVVTIEVGGDLGADEMAACRRTLEEVEAEHGSLRLLARYGDVDLTRIAPRAYLEDLENVPLVRHVERCAIVAHQRWVRAVSELGGRIVPGELRTFDRGETDAARAWLLS